LFTFQLHQAADAYQQGGTANLRKYLASLDATFGTEHFITDTSCRDVTTGVDHADLLNAPRGAFGRGRKFNGRNVMIQSSSDGRWRLIVVARPAFEMSEFVLYYLLILAIVAVLWVLVIQVTAPLRDLARVVERFGRGDLSVRAEADRPDEIGDLGRSFNGMADRITTLLAAERRLLQDVSHELRSPLARLNFAVELSRTAADREAAADRMKREIDHLSELVGGLLEATRLEGEQGDRAERWVDLRSVVSSVVGTCAIEADAKRCSIVVRGECPKALPGDATLIRRSIENVIRNAIRYSPEASPIDVTLEQNDAGARLSIRDFGPGVPEQALARIFEPFYRVDGARDAATGGVGLGLSIAHRAIALHCGQLDAKNARPGLLVTMTIPA
jgi:signal transduction histidine kinase